MTYVTKAVNNELIDLKHCTFQPSDEWVCQCSIFKQIPILSNVYVWKDLSRYRLFQQNYWLVLKNYCDLV